MNVEQHVIAEALESERFGVLLVEDTAYTAAAMSLTLEHHGFEVHVADTASAALDALSGRSFDLAIVDLGLPDTPGHDLLLQLRKRTPGTRLVACSAHEPDSDPMRLARERADAVLGKDTFASSIDLLRSLAAAGAEHR